MEVKPVYCHFSFRRPKGKDYGIFAVAIYSDSEGKDILARRVRAYRLWQDHQHITAIQAYANALNCIWEWQSRMMKFGVTNVILVTDNSNLAKWIQNPKKNKTFKPYMEKAYEPFHSGEKELLLGVGLCAPRNLEKSHKFCREDLVENWGSLKSSYGEAKSNNTSKPAAKTRLDMGALGLSSIQDILDEDEPVGISSFQPMKSDGVTLEWTVDSKNKKDNQ